MLARVSPELRELIGPMEWLGRPEVRSAILSLLSDPKPDSDSNEVVKREVTGI